MFYVILYFILAILYVYRTMLSLLVCTHQKCNLNINNHVTYYLNANVVRRGELGSMVKAIDIWWVVRKMYKLFQKCGWLSIFHQSLKCVEVLQYIFCVKYLKDIQIFTYFVGMIFRLITGIFQVYYFVTKYQCMKSKPDIFNTVCHKMSPFLIL